jgi:hypothetical protein
MRSISLAVMLLGFFLSFSANAQTVTTEQYRHPQTEKDMNFNKAYLAGIKDGLIAYNLSAENKLFCMPGPIPVLSFEQANDIAMRWANKKAVNADSLPLGLTLLYGLKETYRCPK